jgi:cytochrome c
MKYYRFNQIAMAVLGALLLFFGARTFIQIAFEEHPPEKPGYEVAGTEEGAEEKKEGGAGGEEAEFILALQTADAGRGADVAKKCAMCHTFDAGGPNGIGPNLHGVLGRKIASHEGYDYSPALKAKAEETWDYLNIDHMTLSPNTFAPGTKMALFPGLPDIKQRADLLIYLRTLTENPPPLPEAPAAAAAPEGGEKKAEGEGAAAPAAAGSGVLALLATADPKKGEADVGVCKVCHSFEKGAPSPMGPPLHDVVGRKIASVEGFNYSPALKAKSGEEWTYEHLDAFIHNPQAFAPGTIMAFPGVPDAKKRAEIIAFLRSETDNPPPLPEAGGAAAPAAAPPAAQDAPAEAAPPAEETVPAPAEDATPEAAPSAPEAAPPVEETAPAPDEEPAPAEEPAPEAAPAPAPEEPAAPAEEAAPPAAETPAPAPAESSDTPSITDLKAPDEPAGHKGEEPSPSQPQPVYPDGAPSAE